MCLSCPSDSFLLSEVVSTLRWFTNLEDILKRLDYVSEVGADLMGSVVAVSGWWYEREGTERAIEETGYEVSQVSIRNTYRTE